MNIVGLRTKLACTALALFLLGCGGTQARSGKPQVAGRQILRSSTSTTVTSTSTTSSTTTTTLPGIGLGATGPDVQVLQTRLRQLHYDVATVNGRFDAPTLDAVLAFQKTNGLARTGRATPDVVAALGTATDPAPMVSGGGAMKVEIDLKRQVLFLYKNGSLDRILSISSGSGQRYCVDGECDYAVTPGGSYRIGRKILGVHVSKLGKLYNPLFFNAGIAIHGSPSVPAYPASHGCIRIPMSSTLWFYDEVPSGTAVYVLGGKTAPVPFGEPEPPPPVSTTTSSVPAPTTTLVPPTTATGPTTSVPASH